jgi:hypothetical protein
MPGRASSHPSSSKRIAAQLNPAVENKLLGYAALATATGVGVLAMAPSSEAKIVYTPAHQTIATGSTLQLDLNGDGINDFRFLNRFSGPVGRGTFSTQRRLL